MPEVPQEKTDSREGSWLEAFSVYAYQIVAQSRVRIQTMSGSEYELQRLTDKNMHVISLGGKRTIEAYSGWEDRPHKIVKNTKGCQENLYDEDIYAVIADGTRPEMIGYFGRLHRGARLNSRLMLYGDFGLQSSEISRIRTLDTLPDTITASAIELLDRYAGRFSGLKKKYDVSDTLSDVAKCDKVILAGARNNRPEDRTIVQQRADEMIMGMLDCVEKNGTLPFSVAELEEISSVFSTLLAHQCFHPKRGMVKVIEKQFSISEKGEKVKYEMAFGIPLADGRAENFRVRRAK